MLKWLKGFGEKPQETGPSPDDALRDLVAMTSDGVIEDVWDAMDQLPHLLPEVERLIREGDLNEFARHSATLWHAYTLSNRGDSVAEFVKPLLQESVRWALTFEVNNVLIGGALGALDGLPAEEKEQLALSVFESLGDLNSRKYWLLLKVRTDAMMRAVARSFVRLPEDRAKMIGAFRQFDAADLPLLEKYHQPKNPNFEFFEIAIQMVQERKKPHG